MPLSSFRLTFAIRSTNDGRGLSPWLSGVTPPLSTGEGADGKIGLGTDGTVGVVLGIPRPNTGALATEKFYWLICCFET